MTTALIKPSLISGEVAPSLFGHVDLVRYQSAASTLRNMLVSYRGGALSRAGFAFVGFSKQTGRNYPPRLIPFSFSVQQGLALEFGNYYMRVVSNGAFVTETPSAVIGATQANPAVVTIAASSVATATANNGSVSSSYETGDTVTLAGGSFTQAGVLTVETTQLTSAAVNVPGKAPGGYYYGGYAPGDSVTLGCLGAFSVAPTIIVNTTEVTGVLSYTNGSGGTPGPAVVTGTTGTGTKFSVNVIIAPGGGLLTIGSFVSQGSYTANPGSSNKYGAYIEYVTGGGLSGVSFVIAMGVKTFSILGGGSFTSNALGGNLTQLSTSGNGQQLTLNDAVFGPNELSVTTPGNYSVFPTSPASQSATSGSGVGATFDLTEQSTSYNTGDWAYFSGIGGMTELNGQTFVLTQLTATTYSLRDVYGNNINSTAFNAFTSAGTLARIYTLTTPWGEQDLRWIKFTESADVMSLCCVNQQTLTEYPGQDLARLADDSWTFSQVIPSATIGPPPSASGSASSSGSVDYEYVATAINSVDGTESIASPIASINGAVDVANTAGTITLECASVNGASIYNWYKAEPSYSSTPPVGAQFGFAGQSYGTQFTDSNIVADYTQVPPTAQNPFARGQIISAEVTNSTGTVTSVTFTINTLTGSGAVLVGIIIGSSLVAILVEENGQNYADTDTVTVNVTGGGSATATLQTGAQSGTYPGCAGYYQERRGYGYSLNNPDTYWWSQPGSPTNFNSRIPPIPSDAITGSPWGQQVNGIQFFTVVAAGLLVWTGLSAWLLVGQGSFATNVQAFTPTSQVANPQAVTGCAPTIAPIKINYDVLFVSSKGSLYYDLPYQLYALSEPVDLTQYSIHLFQDFTIVDHAWCEQPYRLLWAVRSDGVLLSLTWLKAEQVSGWARHDTQGSFQSVCSVSEPPVDALYTAVQRNLYGGRCYTIERADNRLWTQAEDCFCVDCGFSLVQPTPNATLTASSATGLGAVTGGAIASGGVNYGPATQFSIVDGPLKPDGTMGPGTGAVPTVTIGAGGVISSVTFSSGNQGSGYLRPKLVALDPSGQGLGLSVALTLSNTMTFTAGASVFSSGNVGSFIRAGGGIAEITAYTSGTQVTANMLQPIASFYPGGQASSQPFAAGEWTLAAPVTFVTAPVLANQTVTGLADGNVIPPTVADAYGNITLPQAASAVTVGLGFQAQVQGVYLDAGEPTVQGQRKKVAAVTARLEASRGVKVGSNQTDGSTLSPPQLAPQWNSLDVLPDQFAPGQSWPFRAYNALCDPLYTGDNRSVVTGGYGKPGQVCFQQDNPLPMNVLAIVSSLLEGDTPEQQARPKQQGRPA